MGAKIEILPADVVYLIAAGEVIDSLAAAVRELAENALDAGATRIAVSLWADQWRLRVADNGHGMSFSDLKQASLPHSTSKIRASQDLWQITSLGFRGEALHSLAQLGELEICSRSPQEEAGWRLIYSSEGDPIQIETVAIAPGTIVTVNHLFGNWLARRQGLPTPAQQLRLVQLTLHHLALCHPHVTWQVEQNDRDWFSIWGSAGTRQILPQLLRNVQPSDLQEVEILNAMPPSANHLTLVLGLPDRCHRHRPDWVKVAVNGRVVQVPELEQTLLSSLRRTLPRDRYPICFLHLRVTPEQVDWNRHPAKAEVYLHHLDQWRSQVTEAIHQALKLNPGSLPEATYSQRVAQLLKSAEAPGAYGRHMPDSSETDALDGSGILSLTAIAQVHHMYILAEHPQGIWLVEQHIAHERVLYEQLCDRWQIVPLESPMILSQLSSMQVEQLQQIGLDVESFGESLWAVRTVPELLVGRSDCVDALLELSQGGDLQTAIVATACRTAIRNGTPLTLPAMQTLLEQWQRTRQPHTCPHGRPIYLSLEESNLSRFFRRHWMIGKSHGI